jgi:Zn-finger nucleic acid-binding protein
MKCPKCANELTSIKRHGIAVQSCPSCHGMWLERQELSELEDESFYFGEHAKGALVADATATAHQCPECPAKLTEFNYRFNDLRLELCPAGHGYWLDESEDDRVLAIMKKEQLETARSIRAEDQWAKTLNHMRTPSFFDKLRDFFR